MKIITQLIDKKSLTFAGSETCKDCYRWDGSGRGMPAEGSPDGVELGAATQEEVKLLLGLRHSQQKTALAACPTLFSSNTTKYSAMDAGSECAQGGSAQGVLPGPISRGKQCAVSPDPNAPRVQHAFANSQGTSSVEIARPEQSVVGPDQNALPVSWQGSISSAQNAQQAQDLSAPASQPRTGLKPIQAAAPPIQGQSRRLPAAASDHCPEAHDYSSWSPQRKILLDLSSTGVEAACNEKSTEQLQLIINLCIDSFTTPAARAQFDQELQEAQDSHGFYKSKLCEFVNKVVKASGLQLVKIESLFNRELAEHYQNFRNVTAAKNGMEPSTITAFHGTSLSSAEQIALAGFKMRKRALYGDGYYTSTRGGVALTYCHSLPLPYIIACQVIVGPTKIGQCMEVNFGQDEQGRNILTSTSSNGDILCSTNAAQIKPMYGFSFKKIDPANILSVPAPTHHSQNLPTAPISHAATERFSVGQSVMVTKQTRSYSFCNGERGTLMDILTKENTKRLIVCLWDESLKDRILCQPTKGGIYSGGTGFLSIPFAHAVAIADWPLSSHSARALLKAQERLQWKPGDVWPPANKASGCLAGSSGNVFFRMDRKPEAPLKWDHLYGGVTSHPLSMRDLESDKYRYFRDGQSVVVECTSFRLRDLIHGKKATVCWFNPYDVYHHPQMGSRICSYYSWVLYFWDEAVQRRLESYHFLTSGFYNTDTCTLTQISEWPSANDNPRAVARAKAFVKWKEGETWPPFVPRVTTSGLSAASAPSPRNLYKAIDLNKLRVDELQGLLKAQGMPSTGNKAELVKRLVASTRVHKAEDSTESTLGKRSRDETSP